jgi:hypothetical protein
MKGHCAKVKLRMSEMIESHLLRVASLNGTIGHSWKLAYAMLLTRKNDYGLATTESALSVANKSLLLGLLLNQSFPYA